jgi:hypothetical protein
MPAAPPPTNIFGWILAYANMAMAFFLGFFFSLLMLPIYGTFKVLISGFSQLLIIFEGIILSGVYLIPKHSRIRYLRGIAFANFFLVLALYIDTMLSRNGNIPFPVFNYPSGATGSDIPPTDQWLGFFLNLLFWMLVGLGISFKLPPKTGPAFRMRVWITISIYLTLAMSGFVALMFD